MREELSNKELLVELQNMRGVLISTLKKYAPDNLKERIKTIEQAHQQIKKLIQVDPEEIIQAVLDHADCHHIPMQGDAGFNPFPRYSVEYDVKDGCHEAVRKVLGVEK